MINSTIAESQILNSIKEYESGNNANDICRELGVHKASFNNWIKKYSGMDSQDLKHMYAELAMNHKMLKDVLSKKF
jgi:putative transposase